MKNETSINHENANSDLGAVRRSFPFRYDWSEKQFFIYACFVDDLQQFYNDWVEQGRKAGRIQFFNTESDGKLTHKYWQPSNICCESGEVLTKENIDVKVGYWLPYLRKPIRKDLKQQAMKFEALECQKIDSSCSDCKHLDRAKSWCNKLDKKTNINENLCHPQNQHCFEHRQS
jgi:hypothetical protein